MALILEIVKDAIRNVLYFIKSNLITFANCLNIILPYIMYFAGQAVSLQRNQISAGGEIFIPLGFLVVIYILKSAANKLGKGITIPLPERRFTEVDDDGEVSIENKRLQELLLYVADLEDWLEKKGLL